MFGIAYVYIERRPGSIYTVHVAFEPLVLSASMLRMPYHWLLEGTTHGLGPDESARHNFDKTAIDTLKTSMNAMLIVAQKQMFCIQDRALCSTATFTDLFSARVVAKQWQCTYRR